MLRHRSKSTSSDCYSAGEPEDHGEPDDPDQTHPRPRRPPRHGHGNLVAQQRRSEPGIVCTDSDLSSMLSGRDNDLSRGGKQQQHQQPRQPHHRRSLTMVRSGFLIRGFLSQEMARMTHDQIFETPVPASATSAAAEVKERRRISTGSYAGATAAKKKKSLSSFRKTSAASGLTFDRDKVVAWDQERDFSIDPTMIGSVIESYLKQHEDRAPGCDAIQEGTTATTTMARKRGNNARRTRSVDVSHVTTAGSLSQRRQQPLAKTLRYSISHPNATSASHKRYIVVDEFDSRPRKLSLKTMLRPAGSQVTVTTTTTAIKLAENESTGLQHMERAFAGMAV